MSFYAENSWGNRPLTLSHMGNEGETMFED